MGNPPYNEGGVSSGTRGTVGKQLWPEFINLSLIYLRNLNSKLLFICPSTWTSFKTKQWNNLATYQVDYLRFIHKQRAVNLFGGSANIALVIFLITNTNQIRPTQIYDPCNKDKLSPFMINTKYIVPHESISLFNKINTLSKRVGSISTYISNALTTESKLSEKWTTSTPYPLVSTDNNILIIKYSSNSKGLVSLSPKLIYPNYSMGNPILDVYGILYPQNKGHKYILNSIKNINDLKLVRDIFYTDVIRYIIAKTKVNQDFLNNKVFESVPNILNLPIQQITNNNINELFGLDSQDLICVRAYAKTGVGRLTEKEVVTYKNFDITKHQNGMTMKQIEYTQNLIRKEQAELEQKRKDRESKKANKTRKASKSAKAAEAAPVPDSKRDGKGLSTRKTRKPKVLRTRRKRKHQRSKSSASTRRNSIIAPEALKHYRIPSQT